MKRKICDMDCFNCVYPDCINDEVKPNYYQIMKHERPDAYRRRLETIKKYARSRYQERKEAGICVMCGKVKTNASVHCEACAE